MYAWRWNFVRPFVDVERAPPTFIKEVNHFAVRHGKAGDFSRVAVVGMGHGIRRKRERPLTLEKARRPDEFFRARRLIIALERRRFLARVVMAAAAFSRTGPALPLPVKLLRNVGVFGCPGVTMYAR